MKRFLVGLLLGLAIIGATAQATTIAAYYQKILAAGTAKPQRRDLNFVGATLTDSAALNRTTVTIDTTGIGAVPTSRTLTTTAPLTCGGGSSCDLSANRTLAITSGTYATVTQHGALQWSMVDAIAASNPPTVTFTTFGDANTGVQFHISQLGSITGARGYWGGACAAGVLVKLWQRSSGTAVKSVTVTVAGAGVYSGTFATPYVIDSTNRNSAYELSAYCATSPNNITYVTVANWSALPVPGRLGGASGPTKFFAAPWLFYDLLDLWSNAAGDVEPLTSSTTLMTPLEPTFTY